MEIYDDLRQVWLSTATESGLTGETPHADMSEFFADIEKETAADASKFLQPWLAIYDLGLVWLSALHMGSDPLITGKPVPPIEKQRTYLLGAAVAYAIAVRRLVVAGLDSPARVILRSLAEIFWVCLACVADPDMAKAYQAASDSIDAERTFWYDNLTAKKLAPRLNDYEVAAGLDDDLRESLYRAITYLTHVPFEPILVSWITDCRKPCKRPSDTSPTSKSAMTSWFRFAGRME